MTDLEWYLEIGGKQSGPHAAKEIVDLVRAGRIPATAQVTAARMSGDWVTAKDLVEAYDELYKKSSIPNSNLAQDTSRIHKASAVNDGADPNFLPPPRPTEQLEATKNIFLNRSDLDSTQDPTEALFQAIQAVREKSNHKVGSTSALTAPSSASARREASPRIRPRIAPQLLLITTLAVIFGGTIYGITLLLGGKKAEIQAVKAPTESSLKAAPLVPVEAPPRPAAKLLDSGGVGKLAPRPLPPRNSPSDSQRMPSRLERGGGARYRDDNEPPLEDERNEPEPEDGENESGLEPGDLGAEGHRNRLKPVDPSQVPLDKVIPESGEAPVEYNGDNQ